MEYGLVLLWLTLYAALALLATPVAAALLPRFPDRGAAFALPTALATVGVVGFWVGHLRFGLVAAVAALLVLAGGAALALARGVEVDRRGYLETMAVFTVAFAFLVAIRAVDPAVHPGGGEKFLDFGLLKSLLRTTALPPEDHWFAGEPVQYYYGGHLVAALLTELTGTVPKYAYNLVLAGFYGALVTAAYGLAGAVADSRGLSRYAAGGAAAVFVGLASNLATPVRVALWVLPGDVGVAVAETLTLDPAWIGGTIRDFGYWPASRVIEGTINEFPFFAFLNGDLHAHMTSTPLLLLVAAVCFAYWRTPAGELWRRRLLVFGAIPPVGGLIAVVNTWSFPSVAGLTALTLLFAPADPLDLVPGNWRRPAAPRLARELGRTVASVGLAGGVLAAALLAALPFFLGTASGRSVAFFPERSSAGGLLIVHGVFLALTALYLARRTSLARRDRDRALVAVALVLGFSLLADAAVLGLVVPPLVVAWILFRHDPRERAGDSETARTPAMGYEAVLAVAAMGLVTVVEFAYVKENAGPNRMNTVFKTYMQVWILWGTAAGVMLVDLVDRRAFREALVTDVRRLRGAVSGPGGDVDARGQADAAGHRSTDIGTGIARSALLSRRALSGVLAVCLVTSLLLYGGLALGDHFVDAPEPTLDGKRFVEERHASEAAAIAWLDEREGQPNIVSAPTLGRYMYFWTSDAWRETNPDRVSGANAPSSLTGVPTVVGWYHEVGYRSEDAYFDRVDDVRTIFTGEPAAQRRLLEQYDVEYVYVGPTERYRFDTITVGGLEGVEPVHESGQVTIYRVTFTGEK